MLERGTRSVSMIFRAVIFTFVPTAIELALVCAVLARAFHPRVSLAVLTTFLVYATWTVALTRVGGAWAGEGREGGFLAHALPFRDRLKGACQSIGTLI